MSARREQHAERGTTAALHHRDFALLWSGQTISVAGDGIFTVALAIETLRIDNHSFALAVVLAARLVPMVALLLVGGVVVDRAPRRLVMLTSDAVRGLMVGAIALLIATRSLSLAGLVVMSLVFGLADAFFSPASTAVVPELVPRELLLSASALSSTSRVFAQQLIGPALGGLVVAALGTAWSFGLDGGSFLVSAACLLMMGTRTRPAPSGQSPLEDLREGFGYVRSQPWLWVSILGAGLANFAIFSPLGVLVPLLVRHVLDRGPTALGLIFASGGAGGLVAILLGGRRGLPRRPVTAMWTGWAGAGLAAAALGVVTDAWEAAPLLAVATALLMYGNLLWSPLMQRLVPHHLLGRASSVDWLASIALSPLGILAAAGVAAAIGIRGTLILGGLLASSAGLCLFYPGVREPERQPEAGHRP